MARIPGPECGHSKPCFIDPGTMCRSLSPVPSPAGCQPLTLPARRQAAPVTNDPFSGATPYDQARSLLRPVLPYGKYGKPLDQLPKTLEELVGKRVSVPTDLFRKYLAKEGIKEADIGGSLVVSLPRVLYFVIHDTSSPVYSGSFPSDINEPTWSAKRGRTSRQPANVFVTRIGTSFTHSDFSHPELATKYSIKYAQKSAQFVHTELMQPRLKDRRGVDAFAPQPGFPVAQLERLAMIYLAASVRHGSWLVPAFHAVVDMEFVHGPSFNHQACLQNNARYGRSARKLCEDPHDDPQNFDLNAWAENLTSVINAVYGVRPAGEEKMRGVGSKA